MPLCHVLTSKSDVYSPEFSLEEIVKIRQSADNSNSLYDDMVKYSESGSESDIALRCGKFISDIEKMRDAARGVSADKLIKALIYSDKYSPLTKTAAFTYLYDCACRYVKSNWSSLYSFVNYFKDVMKKGDAGSEPEKGAKDAVRIMTIHQSKGLEFNVCFLFGFGRQFNLNNRSPIIFNKAFGASMKLPPQTCEDTLDKISTRYEDNPIFRAVDRNNKLKQVEEEARIFYVALTRARERLYISATLSKSMDQYTANLKSCADISYEIKKSATYIRWILLALTQGKISDDILDLMIYDKGTVEPCVPFTRFTSVSFSRPANEEEKRYARLLNSSYDKDKNSAWLTSIPSRVAASKVTPHMLDDSVFIPIPTGKLFSDEDEEEYEISADDKKRIQTRIELMRSAPADFDSLLEVNKKPTAAEKGTATHAFLQFCDFENVEKNGIDEEMARLLEGKFITERTAKIINRNQLKGLFKSELYGYIGSAKKVHREFHFGMFRDASDFTESAEMKKALEGKKIYVQGSIDLVVETEDGEIILCDYKTDTIRAEEKADRVLLEKNMKEKHGEQLEQYAYACEKIFGKSPKHIFIYSLPLEDTIKIK